jgi:adenylate cyclase
MAAARTRPYLLVVAAAVAAAFCLTPWGQTLDRLAYDSYFGIRGHQQLSDDIVFVAIDETSFEEVGLRWPWPRALHAQLLENIYAAGAKVVAIDILLPEASATESDAALAEVLRKYGTTILAADVSRSENNQFVVENNIQPLDIFLTPNTRVGHVRTPTDPDGFVRRADLELRDLRSLGYEATLAYTDGDCCQGLPADDLPLINFSGGPETVRTVSYYQALDPDKYLPADIFRNKLVILGVNTTSSAMPEERRPDHFPTPFTRWGEGYSPGSMVHANVAAALLGRGFMEASPLLLTCLAGLLLAIIYGLVTFNLSLITSTWIASGLTLAVFIGAYSAFTQQFYISPVALLLPLLAVYIFSPYYRYLAEAKQRAFIRDAFSTYVNPSIVAQLEQDPDSVKLGGKQVDGTALFLDIAGFASLTEKHSPEMVVDFINQFLSALIDIAMDKGGTVERFLGDAVMVIWGAPVEQEDHAQRACQAGVAMALEIARISAAESERIGAPVHARVGINSGSMTAGNIGANRRFNYTVLGDSVNLAARLEGINKIYQSTVIIGAATAAQLGDNFVLRYLDTVTVKGREQAEKIYELLGLNGEVPPEKLQAAEAYAEGMTAYQKRNWQKASDSFTKGLEADPADGPCAVLKARCTVFADNEPTADWNGVFDISVK